MANKNQAFNRWISDGHKLEYETAIATIYNLEALDPNNTWLDLVKLLQQNERADGTVHFYTTDTTPEYKTIVDPKGNGWSSFTFDQGDWENQSYHEHVDAGGSVGGGWGLWRAKAWRLVAPVSPAPPSRATSRPRVSESSYPFGHQ